MDTASKPKYSKQCYRPREHELLALQKLVEHNVVVIECKSQAEARTQSVRLRGILHHKHPDLTKGIKIAHQSGPSGSVLCMWFTSAWNPVKWGNSCTLLIREAYARSSVATWVEDASSTKQLLEDSLAGFREEIGTSVDPTKVDLREILQTKIDSLKKGAK